MDAPFVRFMETLALATNETQKREAFIGLAATAFSDTELARDLALGAEYKVRFQQSGVLRRGRVDCYYGNLIIEFEHDLRKTGLHAIEQLQGYVAGAWTEDGDANRPYLAVASDGIRWQVFTPQLKDVDGPFSAENVALDLSEDLTAALDNPAALRQFLNRLFFRKNLLKPTAINFTQDFGLLSPAFLQSRLVLQRKLIELDGDSQRELLQSEWDAALRVAYGGSVGSDELFLRHTYLASLARLLVFVALEHRPLKDDEVAAVLDGDYFRGRQLRNIAESDFFSWHQVDSNTHADKVWVALSHQLAGYDLDRIDEDVLKPLYESLVDPVFRHDLGEYYTPDWLAERVVNHLLSKWDWSEGVPAVVDPACGSGTFLRAAIAAVRSKFAEGKLGQTDELAAILQAVVGVDVHPLAIIIARATYVLAVSDLIASATEAVSVPVYLSNSLERIEIVEVLSLFGESEVNLTVGAGLWAKTFPIEMSLIRSVSVFDRAIDNVVEIAESYASTSDDPERARNVVKRRISGDLAEWPSAVVQLSAMAVHLVALIKARQDSIWGFLLRNRNRPTMLRETFDFVVGNPPWLTIGDIANADYQESVRALASATGIAPRASGDQSHTELATLFIPQAYRLFAKRNTGRTRPNVAFVLPRSIMTATHHRLLREGRQRDRFAIAELWDLDRVRPLFNVPSCVLFCRDGAPTPERAFVGQVLSGSLPEKDASTKVADARLTSTDVTFRLSRLAKRSAWALDAGGPMDDGFMAPSSAYLSSFRQGAIIYPQTLFVVKSESGAPISRRVAQVRVRTDPAAQADAKLLRTTSANHLVETESCFSTLAAAHIMPYATRGEPWTVVLPATVSPSDPSFVPVEPSLLRDAGLIRTASWLEWANDQWKTVRKVSELVDIWTRLDYHNQFSSQGGRAKHVVLYTSSGSRAFATAFDSSEMALPFVARDKTYWAAFESWNEAAFVCAYLNADVTLQRVSSFMTRGLQGLRDTHKRVLDVPFPPFDPMNRTHRRLADVSSDILRVAAKAAAKLPSTTSTGRARTAVRAAIKDKLLDRVEEYVTVLVDEREASVPRVVRRG